MLRASAASAVNRLHARYYAPCRYARCCRLPCLIRDCRLPCLRHALLLRCLSLPVAIFAAAGFAFHCDVVITIRMSPPLYGAAAAAIDADAYADDIFDADIAALAIDAFSRC